MLPQQYLKYPIIFPKESFIYLQMDLYPLGFVKRSLYLHLNGYFIFYIFDNTFRASRFEVQSFRWM